MRAGRLRIRDLLVLSGGLLAVAAVVGICRSIPGVVPTTVGLPYSSSYS